MGGAGPARQHQAWTTTARYKKAQAQALEWEEAARRATAQALAAEEEADAIMRRVALQQHAAARSAPEYYDPAGVCHVCNAPIPDAPARRRDGLRVCTEETCPVPRSPPPPINPRPCRAWPMQGQLSWMPIWRTGVLRR